MKYFLFLGLFSLAFMNCKNEVRVEPAALTGKWNVYSGARNGQEVNYFSGFYLNFKENDQLETNINASSEVETGTFDLNSNKIIQKTTSGEINHEIVAFEDSSMILITQLGGHDLKFVLKKE